MDSVASLRVVSGVNFSEARTSMNIPDKTSNARKLTDEDRFVCFA